MVGLVLTAGGSRGAYQAGVLKRIGEISRLRDQPSPFSIITGASAGAINGASIASGSDDFYQATRQLSSLWAEIRFQDVFKTDPISLGMRSARWIHDLSLGGLWGGGGIQSLLDFLPLRSHLSKHISFEGISLGIEKRHLYALAISATNYYSGKSFTFVQGQSGHPLWEKSRRVSLPVTLNVNHVWASCAIPIIFQPVLVRIKTGDFYFGDGGLRLITPLSPAIRLGANRVFAIGIRSQKSAEVRLKAELLEKTEEDNKFTMKRPPLAQVLGVALNSIFLDHLDTDLEHLKRMNDFLTTHKIDPESAGMKEPLRVIRPLVVNPSIDLASIAEQFTHKMPRIVRYLMDGLGTGKAQSADLVSYLLFDSAYTQALIDLGYHDANEHLLEIEALLWDQPKI